MPATTGEGLAMIGGIVALDRIFVIEDDSGPQDSADGSFELVIRASGGDQSALETLFARYSTHVPS